MKKLKEKEKEIEDLKVEQLEVLQKVANLTREEAKKQLLSSVEQEITAEKAVLIRELEQKAKEEALVITHSYASIAAGIAASPLPFNSTFSMRATSLLKFTTPQKKPSVFPFTFAALQI